MGFLTSKNLPPFALYGGSYTIIICGDNDLIKETSGDYCAVRLNNYWNAAKVLH